MTAYPEETLWPQRSMPLTMQLAEVSRSRVRDAFVLADPLARSNSECDLGGDLVLECRIQDDSPYEGLAQEDICMVVVCAARIGSGNDANRPWATRESDFQDLAPGNLGRAGTRTFLLRSAVITGFGN